MIKNSFIEGIMAKTAAQQFYINKNNKTDFI